MARTFVCEICHHTFSLEKRPKNREAVCPECGHQFKIKSKRKKPAATQRNNGEATSQHGKWSPIAVIAAGAAVLFSIGLCALFAFMKTNGAGEAGDGNSSVAQNEDPNNDDGGKGNASVRFVNGKWPSDGFVIFDKPLDNVPSKAVTAKLAPAFQPVADSNVSQTNVSQTPSLPQQTPSAQAETGYWNVAIDASIEQPAQKYAEDLDIPISPCVIRRVSFAEVIPPIAASMNGPYLLIPPAWTEPPYEYVSNAARQAQPSGKKRKRGREKEYEEKKQPPLEVIDLRSGRKAGNFHWQVPFFRDPRLSPDGKYLVGPDSGPDWLLGGGGKKVYELKPETLFVWRQRAAKPSEELTFKGVVLWADFYAPDEFAIYSVDAGKPSLHFWNVATGESIASIELPDAAFDVFRSLRVPEPKMVMSYYIPSRGIAGVSPSGEYIALGGVKEVSLVSTESKSVVGSIPYQDLEFQSQLPVSNPKDYSAVTFTHDGSEIWIGAGVSATRLSAATGTWIGQDKRGMLGSRLLEEDRLHAYLTTSIPPSRAGREKNRDTTMGTRLFEWQSGIRLTADPIIRWSPAGTSIFLGPGAADEKTRSQGLRVYASRELPAKIEQTLTTTTDGLPARPEAIATDRSQMLTARSEPPANWQAFEKQQPAPVRQVAALPHWPAKFGDRHYIFVDQKRVRHTNGKKESQYLEVGLTLVELETGQAAGPRQVLLPMAISPASKEESYALSPDGSLFAAVDPLFPRRVNVWKTDGEFLVGFFPRGHEHVSPAGREGYDAFGREDQTTSSRNRSRKGVSPADPPPNVTWVGWTRDNQLASIADGDLSLWKIPEARALFEITGDHAPVARIADSGRWMAVSSTTMIDLIDLSNGNCLGRRNVPAGTRASHFCISPDEQMLVVAFQPVGSSKSASSLLLWDLQTGSARQSTVPSKGVYSPHPLVLHWSDAEFLLCDQTTSHLCDLRINHWSAHYDILFGNQHKIGTLRTSPGNPSRLWISADGSNDLEHPWKTIRIPDASRQQQEAIISDPSRELVDVMHAPIYLEINAGSEANSRRRGRQVIQELQARGYKIGRGGSKLTIAFSIEDSNATFDFGSNEAIPKIVFHWKLTNQDGKEIWTGESVSAFLRQSSKYHVSEFEAKMEGVVTHKPSQPGEKVDNYYFPNGDMRSSIVEECFERTFKTRPIQSLPRIFLKTGKQIAEFPVDLQIQFDQEAEGG